MRPSCQEPLPARRTFILGGVLSALAAALLWSWALIQAWPRLMAGGAICGAEPVFLGHCPACVPALAATLMAAGFAIALAAHRTLAPARS